MKKGWLRFSAKELDISLTLDSGQCFTWRKTKPFEYTNCIETALVTLCQARDRVEYTIISNPNQIDVEDALHRYFHAQYSLQDMYKEWSVDPGFCAKAKRFDGLRLLNQCPVENTFSFICSANNNISRITKMVLHLSSRYGTKAGTVHGVEIFNFPTIEQLSAATEKDLRESGFGYRARYIFQTAVFLNQHDDWFGQFKTLDYISARKEMQTLSGVGPKVADCIALMSLGYLQSVPVDVHVLKVAIRDYKFSVKGAKGAKLSMTPAIYHGVAEFFRDLFGSKAGWAQTLLFIADLKKYADYDKELSIEVKKEFDSSNIKYKELSIEVKKEFDSSNIKYKELSIEVKKEFDSPNVKYKEPSIEVKRSSTHRISSTRNHQ